MTTRGVRPGEKLQVAVSIMTCIMMVGGGLWQGGRIVSQITETETKRDEWMKSTDTRLQNLESGFKEIKQSLEKLTGRK